MFESIGRAVIHYRTRLLPPIPEGSIGIVPAGFRAFFRALTEIVTVSGGALSYIKTTINKQVVQTLEEPATEILDTLEKTLDLARTITENTINITDDLTRQILHPGEQPELITVTDEAIISQRQKSRAVTTESIEISEDITIEAPFLGILKTLDETVTVGDGAATISAVERVRELSDGVFHQSETVTIQSSGGFQAKLLSFTKPTAGAAPQDQVSVSLGFTPKGAIAYHAARSTTSFTDQLDLGMGFSDGTNHRCRAISSQDNITTSNTSKTERSSFIAMCSPTSGTLRDEAEVSFQSDTITLTWSTLSANAGHVFVFVFGGSDVTDVEVGDFGSATATGSHTTTGTDFTPDCELYLGNFGTSLNVNSANALWGFGAAMSSSKQWITGGIIRSGVTTTDTRRYQNNSECYSRLNTTDGSVAAASSLTAFTSTGRTLNYSSAETTSRKVYFMAIKGAKIDMGSFSVTSGTGNFTPVTGMVFQPKAVMLAATGDNNNVTSSTAQFRQSIGVAISPAERGCVSVHDVDNVGTASHNSQIHSTTRCLRLHTAAATGSSSTSELELDLASMDSDGFTLNKIVNTTTLGNELVFWLAMG